MSKIKEISDIFDQMEKEGIMKDGVSIFTAGFYSFGRAETLMHEVNRRGYKNLTVTTNDCATPEFPEEGIPEGCINALLRNEKIKELNISYKGPFKDVNAYVEKQMREGNLELNFIPQGNLIKQIWAGGAGVEGFYTEVGVGTEVEDGKESRELNGKEVILELPRRANIAFIKAHKADKYGNLIYNATEANFNPEMATAATFVVAEAEKIVKGKLSPHLIHTPGNYIDAVVEATFKPIGRYATAADISPKAEKIARRAALELQDGYVVNLGVGIPTAVTNFLPGGITIWLQSENGILGMGRALKKGEKILEGIIDAGRNYVQIVRGASLFTSLQSFGMIDGEHVDAAFLGTIEVDQYGNIANWKIKGDKPGDPPKMASGMGGGLNLAAKAKRLYVLTEHFRVKKDKKTGEKTIIPKIKKLCEQPLTAKGKVKRIISDIAVMDVVDKGLLVVEKDPKYSFKDLQEVTEAKLIKPKDGIKDYRKK